MNFVLHFMSIILFVTMCQKPHYKIVHNCLTILRCLSTCKITKFHSSIKLESCISFLCKCILVKLSSCVILPMLPVTLDLNLCHENGYQFGPKSFLDITVNSWLANPQEEAP